MGEFGAALAMIPMRKNGVNFMKKKTVMFGFLAAFILVFVGVLLCAFCAPKTVNGDWELVVNPEISSATPDEAEESERVFYSFENQNGYGSGKYKTFFDGGVEEGEYRLSEKDETKFINLGTKDMEYDIVGVKLIKSAKLTVTYPETYDEQTGETTPAQDYVFAQAKAPEYEKMPFDSFAVDDALIGEWTADRTLSYYANELSYTESVRFLDSGIMTIHYESTDLALNRYMYYAYSAEKSELTFALVTDLDTKYNVAYAFDNGDLKFTNDDTSASIFADAFFSDAVFSAAGKEK